LPTNVTPQSEKQREVYEDTEDLAQRIVELEKLLALAPNHKGGERMLADYRKKLAQLKALFEKRREQERARRSEAVLKRESSGRRGQVKSA